MNDEYKTPLLIKCEKLEAKLKVAEEGLEELRRILEIRCAATAQKAEILAAKILQKIKAD